MIKRTIEISQQAVHVAVKNRQLLLLKRTENKGRQDADAAGPPTAPPRWQHRGCSDDLLAAVACEDIGLLLVEHPGVTYSHAALLALLECDAAVAFCGRDHLPAGLLLPLSGHSQVVWRIHDQIAATGPLKKRLWRQLVRAKVRAQALNLSSGTPARSRLLELARKVRSGDVSNIEALAARCYWAAWLDEAQCPAAERPFRRDPERGGVNAMLNYGYAVVRAAVARAIVSAGLLPAIGIHHANRANAFCLADDLLEPLRPIVDARVRDLLAEGLDALDRPCKAGLLEVLTIEVRSGEEQTGPLLVALHRYIASLVRCFEGVSEELVIPVLPGAS